MSKINKDIQGSVGIGIYKDFTKLTKEYTDDIGRELIKHAQKGKSLETFCAKQHIDLDVFAKWYNENPNIRAIIKLANVCELMFWEDLLINHLTSTRLDEKGSSLSIIEKRLSEIRKYTINKQLRLETMQVESQKDYDEHNATQAIEGLYASSY